MSEEIISLWIAFVLAVGLSGALLIFALTSAKCFKDESTVRRRKSVDKIMKERGRLLAKIQQIRADIPDTARYGKAYVRPACIL
mgnify:CR=1 FL=1|jgi:hypothetical protein